MDRIIQGIQQFQDEIFPGKRDLFQRLARGQAPETLVVACADSRVSPDHITQADPGELFVCRNAGNIVPSYGRTDAISASIEYALTVLPIRDIVVCGHSDCGAMKGLLHPHSLSEMPHVQSWLSHAQEALLAMELDGVAPHSPEALPAITKRNIRQQLEHLYSYPKVVTRVREGSLRLHGWFYQIEAGEVHLWEASGDQWVPLREAASLQPAKRLAAGSTEVQHA